MNVSPLRQDPRYALEPREVIRSRAESMFNAWVSGATYEDLAQQNGMTVDGVREVLKIWVMQLWVAYTKWKTAEMKCHALAFELRYLRAGQDCPQDQPLSTLNPPVPWAKAFAAVGIETVNQLRAVDAALLLNRRIYRTRRRFPRGAIDWAILKMDRMGIGHALTIPRRMTRPFDVKGYRKGRKP